MSHEKIVKTPFQVLKYLFKKTPVVTLDVESNKNNVPPPPNFYQHEKEHFFEEQWDTERLAIIPTKQEDLIELSKMFMSYNVTKYIQEWPIQFFSEEEAHQYLTETIWDLYQMPFTIKRKSDGVIIGQVAYLVTKGSILNITYWLGESYQGQGYASEAVLELTDHIFSKYECLKVFDISFFKENCASKKLGLKIISYLLEKHPEYQIPPNVDQINFKTFEVVEFTDEFVTIHELYQNSWTGSSTKNFPQEFLRKGTIINRDECKLLLVKSSEYLDLV